MMNSAVFLAPGTKIRTRPLLFQIFGLSVADRFLRNRKAGVEGTICGSVAGHGCQVYWVKQEGGLFDEAVYGWNEFDLVVLFKEEDGS